MPSIKEFAVDVSLPLRRYRAENLLGVVYLHPDPDGWLYDADQVDRQMDALRAQRDELLAACEAVLNWFDLPVLADGGAMQDHAMTLLRTAVVRARETS